MLSTLIREAENKNGRKDVPHGRNAEPLLTKRVLYHRTPFTSATTSSGFKLSAHAQNA